MKQVIVAGGTGYVGRPFVEKLCLQGYRVSAIARPASVSKLPAGCSVIMGDVLDSRSYQDQIPPGSTFVHMVMKSYIEVRARCEEIIRESRLNATILRPWYILGPGHRWPCVLIPFYKLFEAIPSKREAAVRLGLVTRAQMADTLAAAVASVPQTFRVIETAEIRAGMRSSL